MTTVKIEIFTFCNRQEVLEKIDPLLQGDIQLETIFHQHGDAERRWAPPFEIWCTIAESDMPKLQEVLQTPELSAHYFRFDYKFGIVVVSLKRRKRRNVRKLLTFAEWLRELDQETIDYFVSENSLWRIADHLLGREELDALDPRYQPVYNFEKGLPQVAVSYMFENQDLTNKSTFCQPARISISKTSYTEVVFRALSILSENERSHLRRIHVRLLYAEQEQWLSERKGMIHFK